MRSNLECKKSKKNQKDSNKKLQRQNMPKGKKKKLERLKKN